jgi:hypothetical protein
MKNEEVVAADIAHEPSDGKSPEAPEFGPCGKIAGTNYFTCDSDTFSAVKDSRKSGQRWNTFLKANNEFSNNLRRWSRTNGNPDIMIRDGKTKVFVSAQKGLKK